MRWSTTLAAWTRREAVLVAALAVAAGVAALAKPGANPVTAHGECLGTLVEPSGTNGFGYDPAFLSMDLGITFGNASDDAKERVSHRARAIARLGESGAFEPLLMG